MKKRQSENSEETKRLFFQKLSKIDKNFQKSTKKRVLVEKSRFFENEKAIFTPASFLYNF